MTQRMAPIDWQCAVIGLLHRAGQRDYHGKNRGAMTTDEFEASQLAWTTGDTPEEFASVLIDSRAAQRQASVVNTPCDLCNGTGIHQGDACPDCLGAGWQADGFSAPEGVAVREVA